LFGVRDNRRFLAAILRHPVFASGDATTAFLGTDFGDDPSLTPVAADIDDWALAAALLFTSAGDRHGWHSSDLGSQPLVLGCGEQRQTVYIQQQNGTIHVRIGEQQRVIAVLQHDRESACVVIDGVHRQIALLQSKQHIWLDSSGIALCFDNQTHAPVASAEGAVSGQLKAPMDGAVMEVRCEPGQTVTKGQVLVVMEAMKMEHSLKAAMGGTVEQIGIRPGDQVKGKQILLTVLPSGGDPD